MLNRKLVRACAGVCTAAAPDPGLSAGPSMDPPLRAVTHGLLIDHRQPCAPTTMCPTSERRCHAPDRLLLCVRVLLSLSPAASGAAVGWFAFAFPGAGVLWPAVG